MIKITTSDFNVKKILHESKLSTLITRYKYHLYGLRQEYNPVVLIEYNSDHCEKEFKKNLIALVEFLDNNGIHTEVFDDINIKNITIGFRRDLREVVNSAKQPVFAAAVLCSIVYALENRVNIEQMKSYKLSSMPRFETRA